MTQTFSFNLIEEKWIPCVRDDGAPDFLNLREVFAQAHHLRAIAGDSPPVTVALHRFVLAILHRVFGPSDYDDWADLWGADPWDMAALTVYLNKWQHKFDLFDPGSPFFQAPDKRVKSKSTISLSHDRASGNNPTLFDHHTEDGGEELTPAQAARALITAQMFGLAGLSGLDQKFTDGTCASGIIFLVQGDNLKQTLLLNMIQYPPDNDQFGSHTEKDAPAWEMEDPFTPNRTTPYGYLDYLTWQNRRVLFQPEQTARGIGVRQMTMGPALRYDPTLLDPMKNYRIDEKLGHLAISFSENRVFWRDSASLFGFDENWLGKARPPATFAWLRGLIKEGLLEKHKRYRTLALGMSKKQAKVFFFRQEQFPMPLDYLTKPDLVIALDTALRHTGTIAFDLVQAARMMGMYLQIPDADKKKWGDVNSNAKEVINAWVAHSGMEQNYWASLDIPFQSFIGDLAQDEEKALSTWHAQLRKSALTAFEQAAECTGNDGRSFKAVVRGQGYLKYRLDEVLPLKEKEVSS
jgi:CRISPR system Cascade subunit CasA